MSRIEVKDGSSEIDDGCDESDSEREKDQKDNKKHRTSTVEYKFLSTGYTIEEAIALSSTYQVDG